MVGMNSVKKAQGKDSIVLVSPNQMRLLFDDFVFDEEKYKLRKADTLLKVDGKLLKLLAYFLKNSGKVVSKEELLDQVWEGRAISDNIVSVSIAKLRKALGHKQGEREYILTVFGQGYRFLLPVTAMPSTVSKASTLSGPTQDSVGTAPLVGRDSVMKRLDSALERARTGKGSICILVGEPGIGKTRVAQALEERGFSERALWSWASCHSMESDPPLWVWTQILREYLRTEPADDIRHVLNERINELTRFTAGGNLVSELAGEESFTGHRTFDGIIQVLKRLSEQRPLVVVLDDLHWADAASLRLLSNLVMDVARWPLLLVGTLRTTEFDAKDISNRHLGYVLGHSNCERIVLNRLTESDVGDYVAAVFGQVDDRLSRAVFEKSEGNPFFMVELLRPWMYAKPPEADDLGFSSFALDIVRQRLRKLDSEIREILSVAAIVGRTFDLNMLCYLTEREEATLIDLLDQPLADDTIIPSSEGTGRFAFGHELIRELLYEELSAAERKSRHLRAGEYLEKKRASGEEVATAELARHFLSALPNGQVAKAVDYADNAAREAARFYAYADMYAFLQQAIRALQSVENPDLQLLCTLLLNLSVAARRLSDGRFLDYLYQAIKLATDNGFSHLLAMAGQQLNVVPGMAAMPGAQRVLETAERMLSEEDKERRAMVLTHLAWTPPNCFNARRVDELLTRAEALARESKSTLAITTVLRGKLFLAGGPANYAAAQAITDELEQKVRAEPELWPLPSIDIQVFRIISSIQRGDQNAVQEAIDCYGMIARKFRSVEIAWYHERMSIVQRMNAGELDGISEAISELNKRAEGIGLQVGRMLCTMDMQVLLSLAGDIQPLAAVLRERLGFTESDPQGLWALKVQHLVEFGLLEEAKAALRAVPAARIYELPADLSYLDTLARLTLGSVAVEAMDYVEALYQLLEPYPEYYAAGVSYHCIGSVSYFLGILARTLGRHRKAVAHLEDALEQNARFNLKVQVVRTRCELARTLAYDTTRTATKRARLFIQQAREDARKMGMHTLFDEAERALHELSR